MVVLGPNSIVRVYGPSGSVHVHEQEDESEPEAYLSFVSNDGEPRTLCGSFRKLGGTLFWALHNKDPTIQGTIFGSPIFGNPPYRS